MVEMTDLEKENRLRGALMDHVGRSNAIGMGELFELVFGQPYEHRINSTKQLRRLITKLRRQGVRICSVSATGGGGYWLAAAGSELEDYTGRLKKQGLKKLAQAARLEKISLPDLLGQIRMNLEG